MKKTLILLATFALLISIPALFVHSEAYAPQIQEFVAFFGIFAPLVFIILSALTNILPPLAVTPLWFISIVLFGPELGFVYSVAANLLGNTVSFYIARIWGRETVIRFAGNDALKHIQKLPALSDAKRVFILKFFGGAASDYISYAAGLSTIAFIPYLIATLFAVLPMMTLGFWLILRIPNRTFTSTASALGIFYAINYVTTFLLIPVSLYLNKKRKIKI